MTDIKDPPFLDAYKIHQGPAPELLPAGSRREWMDNMRDRVAYRCLPMTMANATGWDILCPFTIDAEWNGGPLNEDLTLSSPDFKGLLDHVVTSLSLIHI